MDFLQIKIQLGGYKGRLPISAFLHSFNKLFQSLIFACVNFTA